MSNVTLSASVRQSLLSLQNTTGLIERTQNRLSTGLRVSSAIDDPVAFFQAKSLSDRAGDFLEKKNDIDQGISTVTAALDGVNAIDSLVKQMKGISNSMKSATDSQMSDLVSQFNDLRSQINNLAADATYQGTNLINGTGQTLSVEFSEKSASLVQITSVDLRSSTAGLNIAANAYYTGDDSVTHAQLFGTTAAEEFANRFLSTTSDFTLTYNGSDTTFNAGDTINFTYGTGSSMSFLVNTASALTIANGGTITVDVVTAATAQTSTTSVALVATATRNLYVAFGQTQLLTAGTSSSGDSFTFTYQGNSTVTLTTADNGLTFSGGGGLAGVITLNVASGQTYTLSAGATITLDVFTAATAQAASTGTNTSIYLVTTAAAFTATTALQYTGAGTGGTDTQLFGVRLGAANSNTGGITANGGEVNFTGLVKAGDTDRINAVIEQADTALTTLRTNSQTLGSNVALLNTRLDFTEKYTSTLQGGSDKLVLADINEEGANLLALQTRQQLGIQSLSLAAQAEASILQLFG